MRVTPQEVVDVANRDLIKRLEAIEQAIVGNHVELIFVPTRSLAHRVEKALARSGEYTHRQVRLVCLPVDDADGSIEADLREHNTKEGSRLDALLEGRIPTE